MAMMSERVVSALEPYVGRIIAQTSIRGTAAALGKSAEELTAEDMPAVEDSVRWLLAPVAPGATIESVIDSILDGA